VYVRGPEVNLAAEFEIGQLAGVAPTDQCPVTYFQHQAHVPAVQHLFAVETGYCFQCSFQLAYQFSLFLKVFFDHRFELFNVIAVLFHTDILLFE